MNEWIEELADLAAAGKPAVLVTVAGIRGSAPREVGAKMIVTATETIGTIGGGQLEYQSTRVAVESLEAEHHTLRSFPLGSSMGQCCGGVVEILFEPISGGMPAWLRDLSALHGQREPAIVATRISRSQPEKAAELRAMLHAWRQDVSAQMMPPNPDYTPDAPSHVRQSQETFSKTL